MTALSTALPPTTAADPLIDGLLAPASAGAELAACAWRIGVDVAGPAADEVDRDARFPRESLAAMREERLLSALIPTELGGQGANLAEVADAVRALAAHCASSALVLAMHSIDIVNLVRHGHTPGIQELIREIARDQLLIANANSEVGIGGDVSRSICAVAPGEDGLVLDKQALAISYGEAADLITATARRSPDAAEGDQVLVVLRRAHATLEPLSTWDTLGLRGTCSRGYRVVAAVEPELVLPEAFSVIGNQGGIQARQILLSAVWVGLAEAAVAKAHEYVRAAARRNVGSTPPAAVRLASMAADVQQARSLLVATLLRWEALDRTGGLDDAGFIMALRGLKVSTSELGVKTATGALEICGIAGLKKDSPFSMDRIIRDTHGGLVMVSNERYLQSNAQLLTARKQV